MKYSRLAAFLLSAIVAFGGVSDASAEIYMKTLSNGCKEFTNRPYGIGWVFYMSESGEQPMINFVSAGKPKTIEDIVHEIAEKFDIDANLVKAIISVESNCDPTAVSKKGAQGLMQLMPATAKSLNVERPLDPRENILGGVKYIKGLLASYGDLKLALAAYNAGPGAVKKHAGIPPYRETIDYVAKVIHNYHKFRSDPNFRLAAGK